MDIHSKPEKKKHKTERERERDREREKEGEGDKHIPHQNDCQTRKDLKKVYHKTRAIDERFSSGSSLSLRSNPSCTSKEKTITTIQN